MPGLKKVLRPRQPLNSSSSSESKEERRWNWSKFFSRRRTLSPNRQLIVNNDADLSQDSTPPSDSPTPSTSDGAKTEASHVNMDDIVDEDQVCLLCLSVPDVWIPIKQCGCKFCLNCMKMYVHCSIKSGQVPVVCPDGNCPKSNHGPSYLTRNEVKHLVPHDVFPLFLRLHLNREVALSPNLMWCPRPGCETVCSVIQTEERKPPKKIFGLFTINRRQRNQSVTCSSCHFQFCAQCKTPWHEKLACPVVTRINADRKSHETDDPVASLELEGSVKRCPFCQVPIERDDGCAQMMCKNCRHVFCWFCLASLDDDFMLRHYDSGPCRSRLGHSRVSVVWHRAQVVSAFLGLGIVFLATSPLILLASPCLLCCLRHHFHSKMSNTNVPENNHDN